jgi:quinoprotein glucose dehydrogenase
MPDERLFQLIRKGVPGTEMPPSTAPDDDVLMIIAYLRDMSGAGAAETVAGNVDNGAKIFASQCALCHRIGDQGGRLGPDLSRIGVARSRAVLMREIRTPSEWVAPAYEAVTLVGRDGQKTRAIKKSEDAFSIQVMDTRERIQGYLKSGLQEVIYEKTSLMPTYGADRMPESELNDLVAYLSMQRRAPPARPEPTSKPRQKP